MLRTVDKIFGCLSILGTLGHTVGTILWAPFLSGIFVWSMGASLGGFVLGALNLLRAGRPTDRPLAWITAIGTAGTVLVALGFGKSIGNCFDPRVVGNVVISTVLVLFSLRTLRTKKSVA